MFEKLGSRNLVEVLPLQVFDEGDFQDLSSVSLLDHYRNFFEPCLLSGSPATFSNNQFITLIRPSNEEGFQNPFLFNRLSQFLKLRFVKMFSGLRPIGDDLFNPAIEECFRFRLSVFREECSQTLS